MNTLEFLIEAIVCLLIGFYVGRTFGRKHNLDFSRLISILPDSLVKNLRKAGFKLRAGQFSNEEELREAVDQASQHGLVELMVPRTEIVWIEGNKTLRQGLSLALRSGFTRIPVIDENLDNVIGIAYVKDLARRTHEHRESESTENVVEHVRKATFVPESKTAAELLKEMQRDQIHMAIVVDEYGGTAGLITIEDILEEIVGEIADEYDDDDLEIEWLSDASARLSARLHIEDFASTFKIEIPESEREDVDSIGGLLAKTLGRVPIPGSTISIAGVKLTAERPVGRRHRIATVLAERIVDEEESVLEQ
jgi:CBS domain containing-hemolysin-like protein